MSLAYKDLLHVDIFSQVSCHRKEIFPNVVGFGGGVIRSRLGKWYWYHSEVRTLPYLRLWNSECHWHDFGGAFQRDESYQEAVVLFAQHDDVT